jgi:hypothetical protein
MGQPFFIAPLKDIYSYAEGLEEKPISKKRGPALLIPPRLGGEHLFE